MSDRRSSPSSRTRSARKGRETPRAPAPSAPPATAQTTSRHPRDHNEPEHKVAGQNACRALFSRRPEDIRRVYVTEETLPQLKDVLKACAERRIAYHVKTAADLDQVAETVHHDGVLFLARRQTEGQVDGLLAWADRLQPGQPAVLVLLEHVKNPHNLGAILRVCAHFGVPFCLRAGETPELSPAAMRTAEGGAEFTRLVPVQDGLEVLVALQGRGFSLLATSSHASLTLGRSPLPERVVVMFGSEGEGLSRRLLGVADDTVAIPGSGALESLNVACASSVVLWELWRGSRRARAKAPGDPALPSSRSGDRHAPRPFDPRPSRTPRPPRPFVVDPTVGPPREDPSGKAGGPRGGRSSRRRGV